MNIPQVSLSNVPKGKDPFEYQMHINYYLNTQLNPYKNCLCFKRVKGNAEVTVYKVGTKSLIEDYHNSIEVSRKQYNLFTLLIQVLDGRHNFSWDYDDDLSPKVQILFQRAMTTIITTIFTPGHGTEQDQRQSLADSLQLHLKHNFKHVEEKKIPLPIVLDVEKDPKRRPSSETKSRTKVQGFRILLKKSDPEDTKSSPHKSPKKDIESEFGSKASPRLSPKATDPEGVPEVKKRHISTLLISDSVDQKRASRKSDPGKKSEVYEGKKRTAFSNSPRKHDDKELKVEKFQSLQEDIVKMDSIELEICSLVWVQLHSMNLKKIYEGSTTLQEYKAKNAAQYDHLEKNHFNHPNMHCLLQEQCRRIFKKFPGLASFSQDIDRHIEMLAVETIKGLILEPIPTEILKSGCLNFFPKELQQKLYTSIANRKIDRFTTLLPCLLDQFILMESIMSTISRHTNTEDKLPKEIIESWMNIATNEMKNPNNETFASCVEAFLRYLLPNEDKDEKKTSCQDQDKKEASSKKVAETSCGDKKEAICKKEVPFQDIKEPIYKNETKISSQDKTEPISIKHEEMSFEDKKTEEPLSLKEKLAYILLTLSQEIYTWPRKVVQNGLPSGVTEDKKDAYGIRWQFCENGILKVFAEAALRSVQDTRPAEFDIIVRHIFSGSIDAPMDKSSIVKIEIKNCSNPEEPISIPLYVFNSLKQGGYKWYQS